MELKQIPSKRIRISIISVIIAAMTLVILFFTFFKNFGTGSKFEINDVFSIDISNNITPGNTIIYPDNGSGPEDINKEFLYGFALKLSLKNSSNNTITFKKITIHIENTEQNNSPNITGYINQIPLNYITDPEPFLCTIKNEGWGQANNTKLYYEISEGAPDELDAETIFSWVEKEIDVGVLYPGENKAYNILNKKDINVDVLNENLNSYYFNAYYSTDAISKTWLANSILFISAESQIISDEDVYGTYDPDGGGSLPRKRDGNFSAVMTIPTSDAEYSKDYFSEDLNDSSIPAYNYGFFEFILLPEQSCKFDIWFEVTMLDGKVKKTKKLKNINIRVPYFENSEFFTIDGVDPILLDIYSLYGKDTTVIYIED